jgi:endo-1,4-beta-D-glucanase Y
MRRPLLLAPLLGLLAGAAFAAPPQRPFPQHVTYAAGTLRPAHRSQAQQDADVVAAYGRWKSRYLAGAGSTPDGQPRYRVLFSADPGAKTVSEGQGYGMVIVALLAGAEPAAQTIFDGLWAYARDHRSAIEPRLMDWQVPADEAAQPGDDNSAFDGDSDIAYALLLAHRQWGSGGRVDYRREAERVLAGMAAATLGPDSHLPLLGDWVDPAGADYNQRTVRPSDFMPGHFRSFARATGDPAWSAAVTAVQAATTALQDRYSPATGLLPDFTVPVSAADPSPRPAPPGFLEGSADGAYSYNAGRVPWRLAADALLHGDATSRAQARRISRWAEAAAGGDPRRIRAGYRLDGTPLPASDFFSTFFAAPLAVAAMLDPAQRSWLERTYDAVHGEVQGYYEDSVTLLCLLLLTGNAWEPEPAPAGACAPTGLCLGGRFQVDATWQTRDGQSGQATPRPLTDDTGVFWFFAPENLELVVKVLDGCTVNGRYWVFAGGLTDVAVRLTVTDTRTGEIRTYTNPQRTPFRPLQDTGAFAGCDG